MYPRRVFQYDFFSPPPPPPFIYMYIYILSQVCKIFNVLSGLWKNDTMYGNVFLREDSLRSPITYKPARIASLVNNLQTTKYVCARQYNAFHPLPHWRFASFANYIHFTFIYRRLQRWMKRLHLKRNSQLGDFKKARHMVTQISEMIIRRNDHQKKWSSEEMIVRRKRLADS